MQETQEMWVQFLGWEDPLEKEMVTCSNMLAREIHGKSMGNPLVGYSTCSWTQLNMKTFMEPIFTQRKAKSKKKNN